MKIRDLQPGQRVRLGGRSAIFVSRTIHPIWPTLQLVIWKLDDGTWSHDALSIAQDVGEVEEYTKETLLVNLRSALLRQ